MGLMRLLTKALLLVALWSVLAHSARVERGDEVLPMATRAPAAAQTFSARPIPLGVQCLGLRLNRTEFANVTSRVLFRLEVSLDGGTTWPTAVDPGIFMEVSTRGGVYMVEGVTQAYSFMYLDIPQPNNPNRMLRGGFRVFTANARFSLDARVRDTPCGD